MNALLHFVANLDYPSGPVMLSATLACMAFIFGGGYWFKKADEKAKADRAARKAAASKPSNGQPTSP